MKFRRRTRLLVATSAFAASVGNVASTGVPAMAVHNAVRSGESATNIIVEDQPFAIRSTSTSRFRLVLPAAAQSATSIHVQVHRRATSRDSVRIIAEGGGTLRTIDDVTIAMSSLNRFGSRGIVVPVSFQLGGDTTALNLPFPGIFPITITAVGNTGELASVRTFVTYADSADATEPVATSLVLAPEFPPSRAADGELAISSATRASIVQLTTALTQLGSPITVQLQPETIGALAESAEPGDKEILDALGTALRGHTVLANTYIPIDPSSAAESGLSDEFTRQLRLGETALKRDLPDVRFSRTTWVSHEPLTAAGASLLRDLGITSIVMLSPKTTTAAREESAAYVARLSLQDGTVMSVLTADLRVTDILDDTTRNDVVSGIQMAAELVAERNDLIDAGAQPDRIKFVIANSSGSVPGAAVLAALSSVLRVTPGIALTEFSNGVVPSESSPSVNLPTEPARDLSTIGAAIFSIGLDRASIGSMLSNESVEPLLWDKLIAVLPASTLSDPNAYVVGVRKLMRAVKLSVTPPAPSTFSLGERKASIRIQIRNSSTNSLKVRVTLSSAKLLFPEAPKIIELAPNASTDVVIPVIARSNGRFPVTVRITTPIGGARVTAPVVLTARVNIIAGLGQIISFVALGLVLLWWAISWRRARRRRAATTVGAP